MAGFLSKKKDFIDFKISESGIDKLSRSKFNIKYYTFSDKSIFLLCSYFYIFFFNKL